MSILKLLLLVSFTAQLAQAKEPTQGTEFPISKTGLRTVVSEEASISISIFIKNQYEKITKTSFVI